MISATHVSILRNSEASLPDALVAGTQIFVTRYVNASLGITAILRGRSGADNYLVYLNRSEVDVLGGMFGDLVWWLVTASLESRFGERSSGTPAAIGKW